MSLDNSRWLYEYRVGVGFTNADITLCPLNLDIITWNDGPLMCGFYITDEEHNP